VWLQSVLPLSEGKMQKLCGLTSQCSRPGAGLRRTVGGCTCAAPACRRCCRRAPRACGWREEPRPCRRLGSSLPARVPSGLAAGSSPPPLPPVSLRRRGTLLAQCCLPSFPLAGRGWVWVGRGYATSLSTLFICLRKRIFRNLVGIIRVQN